MKNLILFLLFFSGTLCYAQAFDGKLLEGDYDYYFRIQNNILDVRYLTVVNNKLLKGGYHLMKNPEGEGFYRGSDHHVQYYDGAGNLVKEVNTAGGVLSSDMTHSLIVRDNDLWVSKVDVLSGQVSRPTQITQLGIFTFSYNFSKAYWWRNNLLFSPSSLTNDCYLLNTLTGELSSFPHWEVCSSGGFGVQGFLSPTSRFIYISNEVFDMQEKTSFKLKGYYFDSFENREFWVTDTSFYLINAGKSDFSGDNTLLIDAVVNRQTVLPEVEEVEVNHYVNNYNKSDDAKWISPNGQYFLHFRSEKDYTERESEIWVSDLRTGVDINTGIVVNLHPQVMQEDDFKILWTTDGTFVYGRKGSLLEQGVWFYDIHNKKHEKVTSYYPRSFLIIKGTNFCIFQASNSKNYRFHIDGTGMKEITSIEYGGEPLHVFD